MAVSAHRAPMKLGPSLPSLRCTRLRIGSVQVCTDFFHRPWVAQRRLARSRQLSRFKSCSWRFGLLFVLARVRKDDQGTMLRHPTSRQRRSHTRMGVHPSEGDLHAPWADVGQRACGAASASSALVTHWAALPLRRGMRSVAAPARAASTRSRPLRPDLPALVKRGIER